MKTLTLLFLTTTIFAQTLTLTGPTNALPGQTVSLSVSLAGASGKSISGVQWTATPSSGGLTASTTQTPNKGIFCGSGSQTCEVIGVVGTTVNNSAISDGTVGQFQFQVPAPAVGNISFPLTGLFAVDSTGLNVATISGAPYVLSVLSKCDVNKDGKTDSADVIAVINGALGIAACPITTCTLQTAIQVLIAATGQSCPL